MTVVRCPLKECTHNANQCCSKKVINLECDPWPYDFYCKDETDSDGKECHK